MGMLKSFDFKNVGIFEPSMESITYQITSGVGRDLEELFHGIIVYRDTIIAENLVDNIYNRSLIIQKVYDYIRYINTGSRIKEIIKKHTGLTVKKINLIMDAKAGCTGCVAVDMIDETYGQYAAQLELRQGRSTIEKDTFDLDNPSKVIEAILNFGTLGDNFDAEKSRVTSDLKSNKEPYEIKEIFLDVNTLFLSSFYVTGIGNDKKITEEDMRYGIEHNTVMTAAEITGVLLHEIGHIMSMIERAVEFIGKSKNLNDMLTYYSEYGDKEKLAKELIKNEAILTRQITDPAKAENFKLNMDKLRFLDNELESENRPHGGIVYSIATILKTIFCTITLYILFFPVNYFQTGITLKFKSYLLNKVNTKHKTSDTIFTDHGFTRDERDADLFVVKHGYGASLAEGLRKILHIVPNSSITNSAVRNFFVFKLIMWVNNQTLHLVDFNVGRHMKDSYELDEFSNSGPRFERMRQNMIGNLKLSTLPNSVVDRMIKDIEKIDQTIRKYQKQNRRTYAGSLVFRKIHSLLVIPIEGLKEIVFGGSTSKQYKELQDITDEISNSDLYLYTAKLKALTRKR